MALSMPNTLSKRQIGHQPAPLSITIVGLQPNTVANTANLLLFAYTCIHYSILHCHIFTCKSLSFKIRPCRNIGQGQPRVIICPNNNGLRSRMFHKIFHQNLHSGSWKEDFKVFLPYGHGSHLGQVNSKMLMTFYKLVSTSLHSKFG